MDHEGRETGGPVGRSHNAVYVMPHDWASIAQFLEPVLERVDTESADLQVLVIASDSELSAAVAAAAVKAVDGRAVQVLAATSARRAARIIRLRPPHVVAGTPEVIVELLRGAAIKLGTVRFVCLAWADELVAQTPNAQSAALETVMAELPKESGRTVVAAELTPAVDELLERYARRARRVAPVASELDQPMDVEYATVAPQSRLGTLRRLLDETDPATAMIFVRDRDTQPEVRDLLDSLGYGGGGGTTEQGENAPAIRMGTTTPPGTEIAFLFDLPASREELREAAGGAQRAIALVQPRQLASLRALVAGGSVRPITLPESGERARRQDLRMREEVRTILAEGHFGRELISLEALLDEYDGIEIAAAALQLLERERAAHQAAQQHERAARRESAPSSPHERSAPAGSARPRERDRGPRAVGSTSGPMVRLFMSVGARDNVRPGDLVGAIANEAAVASTDLGRIDIRESHSIVEVAPSAADAVIERVNGLVIRGRRTVVRRDEERAGGPRGLGGRSSRGAGGGGRGPREGARSGPRRGADTGRGTRPPRPPRRRDDE